MGKTVHVAGTKCDKQLSGVLAGTLLILGVVLISYFPAMRAGFVWDDDSMLTGNIVLQRDGLFRSWFTTEPLNYWPVTATSYWLEHRLWGLEPAGYHLTNILIHAACAALIWRVLRRLGVPAALPAALIFALHPVNVESVAWIAQRKTILAMLFFLIALLLYLRFEAGRDRRFYLASVASFALALLGKGSVVGLPVVLLLCAWWQRGAVRRIDLVRCFPFFAMAAVMSAVEIWFQYGRAIGGEVVRTDGFLARAAGAGTVVWFYLSKALVPAPLIFMYPRWRTDPAAVMTWVPDLALLAAFALGWRFRRGWGRALLLTLGYTVVMLSPVLGFFDIYFMRYSPVADHYQYASIVGVIALVAAAGWRLAGLPAPQAVVSPGATAPAAPARSG